MPESAAHAALVQAVILYAEREFGSLADIAVREDAVRPMRGERPPRIEGYVPDVFVTDVPTTTTLIGEAKTQQDIETDHSRRQIFAFLLPFVEDAAGHLRSERTDSCRRNGPAVSWRNQRALRRRRHSNGRA